MDKIKYLCIWDYHMSLFMHNNGDFDDMIAFESLRGQVEFKMFSQLYKFICNVQEITSYMINRK